MLAHAQAIMLEHLQYFLSTAPLVTLLAFIVVPAYKRIVFEDVLSLIWTMFLAAVFGVVWPWLRTFDFVQEMIELAAVDRKGTNNSIGDNVGGIFESR